MSRRQYNKPVARVPGLRLARKRNCEQTLGLEYVPLPTTYPVTRIPEPNQSTMKMSNLKEAACSDL